jgi:hypothetical protein
MEHEQIMSLANAHLLAVGLWLGCILVEVLFEKHLAGVETSRLPLAELHRLVDLYIETPAFVVVLGTGVIMLLHGVVYTVPIGVMILSGMLAVAANTYCVLLVLARRRHAVNGDTVRYDLVDRRQHQWGALVLLAVGVALIAGVM